MNGNASDAQGSKGNASQEFLDATLYPRKFIEFVEKIYGGMYISPGGDMATHEYCEKINLKPGQKVLDVGCGPGGAAIYMGEKFGANVLGVDLGSNTLAVANEKLASMSQSVRDNVKFEMADITKTKFEANSFDVIHSRDVMLHIPNKELLFTQLKTYLKPGGTLFITDFCKGDRKDYSQEFLDYVNNKGYDLRTVSEYGQILERVGFRNVQAIDATPKMIEFVDNELAKFEPMKAQFIKEFSEKEFNSVLQLWHTKYNNYTSGNQAWGMFIATK